MQAIVEGVVELVPRAIGWAFLKVVTLGRYRGFRNEDLVAEGGIGLVVIACICLLGYSWWR